MMMAGRKPNWANWKAQDKNGDRCYFEFKPKPYCDTWTTGGKCQEYMQSEPNEDWESTLTRI